jgi:hypothetical protein
MDAFETVQDLLARAQTTNQMKELCDVLTHAMCDSLGVEAVLKSLKDYAVNAVEYCEMSGEHDDVRTWTRITGSLEIAHRSVVRQLHPGG